MGITVNDTTILENGHIIDSHYVGIKDGKLEIRRYGPEFYHIEAEFGFYLSREARDAGFQPFRVVTSCARSNVAPTTTAYELVYKELKENWIKNYTDDEDFTPTEETSNTTPVEESTTV